MIFILTVVHGILVNFEYVRITVLELALEMFLINEAICLVNKNA